MNELPLAVPSLSQASCLHTGPTVPANVFKLAVEHFVEEYAVRCLKSLSLFEATHHCLVK